MSKRLALCALLSACLLSAQAPLPTSRTILDTWLTLYNKGNDTSLKQFQKAYMGNDQIDFARDSREESGGFDLTKIESDEPLQLTAVLKARADGSPWELTMTRETLASPSLTRFRYTQAPQNEAQTIALLDGFATRLNALGKFSGVIALYRDGTPLFKKSWGLIGAPGSAPITPETRFYFASQGKMFTAIAVLQLIEAGKVSLDDQLRKFFPDYPNAEMRKVTVRQLLTHQAGAGDMGILQPQDVANRAKIHSIAEILALNGDRPPAFPPGTKADYSNYGFLLLGAIVEKASGQSYYDYVTEHVFERADMMHTSFPLREDTAGIAMGYTATDGPLRSAADQLPWRGTPAGGGVSTADDLEHFFAALNNGQLLSAQLLSQATSKQIPWYGYGFIVSGMPEDPYWGHGGGARGNSLVADYYPKSRVTFICEANRDPPVCDRLAAGYTFRLPRTH